MPPSGPQAHPQKRDLGGDPREGELCLPPVPTHKEWSTRSRRLQSWRSSAYGGDKKATNA